VPTNDVHAVIDLCNRVIAMTIGLIRKLSRHRPWRISHLASRIPHPASRIPHPASRL